MYVAKCLNCDFIADYSKEIPERCPECGSKTHRISARATKCLHCNFIDYLDAKPLRCPKCGSITQRMTNPFEEESIRVKVRSTRSKVRKVKVTFDDASKIVDKIIGTAFKKPLPDPDARIRVIFMVKAYVWILLKLYPQMWLNIDPVVEGPNSSNDM